LIASRRSTFHAVTGALQVSLFREDREHIACLCAGLCKPFTKVYACASSAGESGWRQANGKAFMNESNAATHTTPACLPHGAGEGNRVGQSRSKFQ
jgi:hypothetical protein